LPVPRLQDRAQRPPARATSGRYSNFYSPPPPVGRPSPAACHRPCISIFRRFSSRVDLILRRRAALEDRPAPEAAAMVDVEAAVAGAGEDDNRWGNVCSE